MNKIKIDGFTVQYTENSVSIYDENGNRKGHFPTKEPVTTENGLREIYNVWKNADKSASTYLAARFKSKETGYER